MDINLIFIAGDTTPKKFAKFAKIILPKFKYTSSQIAGQLPRD